MDRDHNELLHSLSELHEPYEFSMIKLTESLAPGSGHDVGGNGSRTSDASDRSMEGSYCANLETDLEHYKELFSKLRFSYLEQVTKEKFLRAILDDPPLIVEHEENVALEARLAQEKASLKAQKIEVAELISKLEAKSRDIGQRYENVEVQSAQARDLPAVIAELQRSIHDLRTSQADQEDDPSRSLSLPATLSLISERQTEISDLDRQLASLQSTLTRKNKELERLETELRPLENQRQASVRAADEARRRKAGLDGGADDLENRGRWWKGVGEGLQEMLDLAA